MNSKYIVALRQGKYQAHSDSLRSKEKVLSKSVSHCSSIKRACAFLKDSRASYERKGASVPLEKKYIYALSMTRTSCAPRVQADVPASYS